MTPIEEEIYKAMWRQLRSRFKAIPKGKLILDSAKAFVGPIRIIEEARWDDAKRINSILTSNNQEDSKSR